VNNGDRQIPHDADWERVSILDFVEYSESLSSDREEISLYSIRATENELGCDGIEKYSIKTALRGCISRGFLKNKYHPNKLLGYD